MFVPNLRCSCPKKSPKTTHYATLMVLASPNYAKIIGSIMDTHKPITGGIPFHTIPDHAVVFRTHGGPKSHAFPYDYRPYLVLTSVTTIITTLPRNIIVL